ncbi:MAG TPA: hypothetical protein VL988_09185 [Solirubrobacteraceae bacterium]|nr:hypothetical protein [Solirubrobacteraceae bacterium]
MSTGVHGRVLLSVCLALSICLAAAALFVAVSPAQAVSWGAAAELELPAGASSSAFGDVLSVSCPAAGSCSAVGSYETDPTHSLPMAITKLNATWQQATAIPLPADADTYEQPRAQLERVSCSAPGYCAAIGEYEDSHGEVQAMAASETAGTWGAATEIQMPENASYGQVAPNTLFNSISCSGPDDCAAVGHYYEGGNQKRRGMFATSTDGTWQAQATRAQLPEPTVEEPGANLASVSCWAPGSCSAVGYFKASVTPTTWRALVISESGGVWSAAAQPPLPAGKQVEEDELDSIVCLGASYCEAAGTSFDGGYTYGLAATQRNGSWEQGTELAPPPGATHELYGGLVACADESRCFTAGNGPFNEGWVATLTGGHPGSEELLALPGATEQPHWKLRDVACTPAAECAAVGNYEEGPEQTHPLLMTASDGSLSPSPSPIVLPANAEREAGFNSISCSPDGNCDAVGGFRSTTAGGHGRPMAISMGEPPAPGATATPASQPVQIGAGHQPATGSPLATIADRRVDGLRLRLLGPSACTAASAPVSLRLIGEHAHRPGFRVTRVRVYIDGGRRTVKLAGRGARRHRVVVHRPQLQGSGASAFVFVPEKMRLRPGVHRLRVAVTLSRYRKVGRRRTVVRETTWLSSTLRVC